MTSVSENIALEMPASAHCSFIGMRPLDHTSHDGDNGDMPGLTSGKIKQLCSTLQ